MHRLASGRAVLAVVAVLLVAAGLVVHRRAAAAEASFGWFAYQPLPVELFGSAVVIWTRVQAVGVGLVVLGVVVAAALVGYHLGAVRARSR